MASSPATATARARARHWAAVRPSRRPTAAAQRSGSPGHCKARAVRASSVTASERPSPPPSPRRRPRAPRGPRGRLGRAPGTGRALPREIIPADRAGPDETPHEDHGGQEEQGKAEGVKDHVRTPQGRGPRARGSRRPRAARSIPVRRTESPAVERSPRYTSGQTMGSPPYSSVLSCATGTGST